MKDIITRLKKINGQISGLIKMLEENQDCEKVLIQFQAAKSALDSAYSESLNKNFEKCLSNKEPEKMKKLIKLISKR